MEVDSPAELKSAGVETDRRGGTAADAGDEAWPPLTKMAVFPVSFSSLLAMDFGPRH